MKPWKNTCAAHPYLTECAGHAAYSSKQSLTLIDPPFASNNMSSTSDDPQINDAVVEYFDANKSSHAFDRAKHPELADTLSSSLMLTPSASYDNPEDTFDVPGTGGISWRAVKGGDIIESVARESFRSIRRRRGCRKMHEICSNRKS